MATFPSEYIFDPKTLAEAQRVLAPMDIYYFARRDHPGERCNGPGDGIIIPHHRGDTTELVRDLAGTIEAIVRNAGFHVEVHEVEMRSSMVFILVATKSTGLS